ANLTPSSALFSNTKPETPAVTFWKAVVSKISHNNHSRERQCLVCTRYIIVRAAGNPANSSLQCKDVHTGQKVDKERLWKLIITNSTPGLLQNFNPTQQCKGSLS
ncbi:hypothetical protein ANANG_G00307560, partial [Anguilla anguilla]